jgi:conjugal transfer pilus assembly protein TraV
MKLPVVLLASVIVGGSLIGCGVKYGCPAPDGVQCKPISEVYSSTLLAKGQFQERSTGEAKSKKGSLPKPASPAMESLPGLPSIPPAPIRSAPKILRVWVAPWIDAEGDLHQESYIYIVVDQGKWAIGLPAMESQAAPTLKISPEDSPQSIQEQPRTGGKDNGK